MTGLLIFMIGVLTLGAIYAILCMALNLEAGIDGLWDLGLVSFFGVGAYTYTLLTCEPAGAGQHYLLGLGLPMWVGVLAAGVMGALIACLIGLPSLRLRKEYFLITTLAFAQVLQQIYANEQWLTNGVAGIYGLPQPLKDHFSPSVHTYALFLLLLVAVAVAYFLVQRLALSPFGRTLKALRENESLAITAGINPFSYHLRSFATAGFLAGIAGSFYVWYNTLVVPGQFSANITFFVWTAVIIGGLGNNRGVLLGGFLFMLINDLLGFLQVSSEMAQVLTSIKTALIGMILIVILRLKPTGLCGERKETITL